MCVHFSFTLKKVAVESQLKAKQFLWKLGRSVHKVLNNHYQHFVKHYIMTNQTTKRADAVRCAQAEWQQQIVNSKEEYIKYSTEESSGAFKAQPEKASLYICSVTQVFKYSDMQ